MTFLEEALSRCVLSEQAEGYLYGRGISEATLKELNPKTWEPLKTPYANSVWQKYGRDGRGEYLEGSLILPVYSPRGKLMGFEARSIEEKRVSKYYLPNNEWNPAWVGMRPSVMEKIWGGADVWVVEGFFDVFPLEWAVPPTDVVLGTGRAWMGRAHLDFLDRYVQRSMVHIAYDNDEAGRNGSDGYEEEGKVRWGALKKLSALKIKNRRVQYPGKDPGEVWDQGGVEYMRQVFGS